MILIPVAIAAVLLLAGGGLAVLLLKRVYLPRLGLSMAALHETGEQLETAFAGAKVIAAIYGGTAIWTRPSAMRLRTNSGPRATAWRRTKQRGRAIRKRFTPRKPSWNRS